MCSANISWTIPPVAPSQADTPVPIPEQNVVTPQATPTVVMPPEVTLLTVMPVRAPPLDKSLLPLR
jgi:hypothetical protein